MYRQMGNLDRKVSSKTSELERGCQQLEEIQGFYAKKLEELSCKLQPCAQNDQSNESED